MRVSNLMQAIVWAGFAVPEASTRLVVAASLEAQLGAAPAVEPPRLQEIAARTDRAVFSGENVDEAGGEAIWTEALGAVAAGRAAVGGARRLLSRYRLRRVRDWIARAARGGEKQG